MKSKILNFSVFIALVIAGAGCGKDDAEEATLTAIEVAPATVTLTDIGATASLTATAKPNGISAQTYTWTSGSPDIVTASSNGTVTAVSAGVAKVWASVGNIKSNEVIVTVSIDSDKDAISSQFANKTVNLPAANFPAVDVTATEVTLVEGKFYAKLNGEQFIGNDFATGVVLPENGVITIEQKGVTLVSFSPKTGGAGTKIKIAGIGSTSTLTTPAGLGRGIYTLTVSEAHRDLNGYLVGYNVYTEGNQANLVNSVELEGGQAYMLRRDHLNGAKDAEGWVLKSWGLPVTFLNGGFDAAYDQAISLYKDSEASKPVDQQIPVISATPKPSSGMIPIIYQNVIREEDGDKYFVQGNGDISCYFKIGNGVRPNDYTFTSQGIPAEHGNQDPYARAFAPDIHFRLYVCNHISDLTDADMASNETATAFVSVDGIDPENNYVIFEVINPEKVNTGEELAFIWQRKATPENAGSKIRFEGMSYDAQNKYFVLTAGMTVRTSPY
ncbi:MAG: Ig-like domain-containing protein [Tannerella sp.]|jgi:hypothetical protein|nr:Ig-like domain-containing protein [Tannerella sp.]